MSAATHPGHDAVIRTRAVAKRYPGTLALDAVDYAVYRGKVNVLIGENGAGKSTLMKILAGAEQPSSGEVLIEGAAVSLRGVRDAERHGVGIIFQELNLFPDLSVAENIHAGSEPTRMGVLRCAHELAEARKVLERLHLQIDPATRLGDLTVGQQQLVEIAKALAKDIKVLIMDEPTSALSRAEVELLFGIIAELKEQGVTIVYISHRLEEIMAIGDHITVLRNGRLVADAQVGQIDIPWIIRAMVGAEHKRFDYHPHPVGETVLEVRGLRLRRCGGRDALAGVSFEVRAGEVIGIYGLMGAGRTELMETLLGAQPLALGSIRLDGRELSGLDIAARIGAGIALVPEDRQRDGMVQPMSILENMTLSSLDAHTRRLPVPHALRALSGRGESGAVDGIVARLRIKIAGRHAPITSLSGGNMQKVVIGKALLTRPRVLLMDEPTRGIDVGAKDDVYRTINQLADSGIAVIYATSELDEAMAVADRVFVMASGRLTAAIDRADFDREAIIRASTPLPALAGA
jgi:erythritol transport system ATP-binding protein